MGLASCKWGLTSCKWGFTHPVAPGHAGDAVPVGAEVAEARHLGGVGGPQVHAGAQPHTQDVGAAPVHQIQVKIVLQFRSV